MTIKKYFLISAIGLFICFNHTYAKGDVGANDGFKQLYLQHQLEEEGKRLAEAGHLDEALGKFNEALNPQYIQYEFEKGMSHISIVKILLWQEKYEEALGRYEKWYLTKKRIPDAALEGKNEILALNSTFAVFDRPRDC